MYTIGQYKNKLESALTLLLIEYCRIIVNDKLDHLHENEIYLSYVNNFMCEMFHSNENFPLSERKIISQCVDIVRQKQNKIISIYTSAIGKAAPSLIKENLPLFWCNINKIIDSNFSGNNED